MDCSSSKNCLSHRGDLDYKIKLDANSTEVIVSMLSFKQLFNTSLLLPIFFVVYFFIYLLTIHCNIIHYLQYCLLTLLQHLLLITYITFGIYNPDY